MASTRVREGDQVMAVLPGSTRASVVFLSNFGVAYTSRIIDIPASTGYGEPIQRFFKLRDRERIVNAMSLDPRVIGEIKAKKEGAEPPVHADEILIAATREARAMISKAEEVNFLSGPGRGVILIKLGEGDRVLGFIASKGDRDLMTVETSRGAEQTISTAKYEVTGRGGKGRVLMQRGQFTRVIWPMPDAPQPFGE